MSDFSRDERLEQLAFECIDRLDNEGSTVVDRDGEPVVVDFGLAYRDDADLQTLTSVGQPIGTAAYMAPEQIAGDAPVDRRTDVYALGVMLFEALALRPPFVESSRDRLYRRVLHERPPNPRRFGVPREICAVLDKALRKNPANRFATALEFAEELERFLRHEPLLTRPPGIALRSWRWIQRNPGATVALATVSVALAITSWALVRSMRTGEQLRRRAIIDEAERIVGEDPWLAIRLAKEALDSEQPELLAMFQQILFEMPEQRTVREREGVPCQYVEFSPDGAYFLVHAPGDRPSVHHGEDGAKIGELPVVLGGQFPPVAFAPDSAKLAIGDGERALVYALDDVESGPTRILEHASVFAGRPEEDHAIFGCAFRAGDGTLVVTDKHGDASLWPADSDTCTVLTDPTTPTNWWRPVFLASGAVVAAGGVWTPDGASVTELRIDDGIVHWIRETAQGLVTGGRFGQVRLWSPTGEALAELARSDENDRFATIRFLDVDVDANNALVSYGNGRTAIVDVQTGNVIDRRPGEGSVLAAFAAHNERVVTADWHGNLALWDLDGRLIRRVAAHRGGIYSVAVDPQSDRRSVRVVTASEDATAKLTSFAPLGGVPIVFDVVHPSVASRANGSVLVVSEGEVAVHGPDARLLARAAADIRVPASGRWAADGSVAISSHDGTARIWDPSSSDEPRVVARSSAPILDVAWSGANRVVTAGRDHTVRWWWVDPKRLRAAVAELELGELTPEQRADFAHVLGR